MNANLMVSADLRTYISFRRIGAYTTEWRNQMTKMKALSAVAILSAAIATPVFAQGPHHGRAHDQFRGAYNQLNGPVYAATDAQERRNIEHFGFTGMDPSRPGGEAPPPHPPAS